MTQAAEPAAPAAGFLTATPRPREGLWLGIALALLACLPFAVARYPQMTDYASHLARWHVMLDQGQSEWLARHYVFTWRWSGNLGADLLIWPMAKLFGLETGGRIIGALVPVLTGLGLISVAWVLRGRVSVGALLAFATIWSPALCMGLLNFGLALALALFAFAGWVRLEGWRWRWLAFIPVGFVVWLAHLAGWGVLGILVLCYEMQRRPSLGGLFAAWPLTFPILLQMGSGEPLGVYLWGKDVVRFKIGIWIQALRDQNFMLDMDTLALMIFGIGYAAYKRKIDPRLGWAALLLFVLTFAMPRHLGGGDYADYRLIAVALMIGCLSIEWRTPRWALWLVPVLFLLRLGVTTQAWDVNSRHMAQVLTVVEQLPQGARVASAVEEDRGSWPLNPIEHVASYATVRRDALVNSHFAIPGVHMLSLRDATADFADPSHRHFVEPGEPIDLAGFTPARQADFLWWVGKREPARLPQGAETIYRAPGTMLVRLAKPAGAR
ncbi:MAG: hypothetical protein AB7F98_03995 [Novosphingobium sp.]